MKGEAPAIVAARIEAERARARLMGTAHELQDRLSPKTLAQNVWEGAKEKGADAAEVAVDAVRARPIAAGGVVAAVALFLVRNPLLDLAQKLFSGPDKPPPKRQGKTKDKDTDQTDQSEQTETIE